MRPVNLLPKEFARPASRVPGAPVIAAAAGPILAGCLVFGAYTLEHSKLRSQQAKLAAVEQQVGALPHHKAAAPVPNAQDEISQRIALRSALDAALLDRIPWDTTFLDLARVLPANVWLTSLDVISPTPGDSSSSGSGADGFSMEGVTYTQDDVGGLLQRLELLPMLSDVTLGSTNTSTIGKRSLIEFSITASIAPPGETVSAT